MKKIVVLLAIFCIISPKIFADENDDVINKYYFPWQLYNYYINNNSNNILFNYHYENNSINLNLLMDTRDISFLDSIYLNNGEIVYKLVEFFYFQYKMIEFIDAFTGGPEKRRREKLENDRRYNILHPAEPLRK